MPLPPTNPYDTLADVTALARTILGDYIAGIKPLASGTVSTNGLIVTWVSGDPFSYLLNGITIYINGIGYLVQSVQSAVQLTLATTAGVQGPVEYLAALPTGDIFADSQAYVLPTVNLAWRKLQKKIADKGHPRLQSEVDIFAVPVVTNQNPVSQQWMSWSQFFDGTNILTPSTVPPGPVLPRDFISPLFIYERQSGPGAVSGVGYNEGGYNEGGYAISAGGGSGGAFGFRRMMPAGDGLLSSAKGCYNRMFDWRNDALYFPGSTVLMDLRIRYSSYLPDLVASAGGFATTQVPIMRSMESLAYYAAAIFVEPRGGADRVASFVEQGDEATDAITNSWVKEQQRSSFHRRSWGGCRRSNFGSYLTGR